MNIELWFESSMCVVNSIDWQKGTSENLWGDNNLPLGIEASVQVQDLYSTMPITRKYSMFTYNLGLASYLDCMAGIRSDELNLVLRAKALIKRQLTRPVAFFDETTQSFSGFVYNMGSKLANILR